MFTPTDIETRLLNRKMGLLKPGHGSAPRIRGRKGKGTKPGTNYSVPSGRSVNRVNPNLPGQSNHVNGMFVESHDVDRYIDCPVRPIGQHKQNTTRQPNNMGGRSLVR